MDEFYVEKLAVKYCEQHSIKRGTAMEAQVITAFCAGYRMSHDKPVERDRANAVRFEHADGCNSGGWGKCDCQDKNPITN